MAVRRPNKEEPTPSTATDPFDWVRKSQNRSSLPSDQETQSPPATPRKATQPVSKTIPAKQPAKRTSTTKKVPATKKVAPVAETVASAPRPVADDNDSWNVGYLEALSESRAGLPDRYDDGIQWLKNGVRRHRAAVIVGLVFGWTGAWLAVWGAMAGIFLGALVGLGASNANIPVFRTFGLGQSVSVVGVAAGVAVGIAGGFLVVLVYLVLHPLALLGSFASGVVIAALLVAVAASYERPGCDCRGSDDSVETRLDRVAPVVKRAADAMQLPSLPRFAIAQQVIPNAWTHMRTIVLTTELCKLSTTVNWKPS